MSTGTELGNINIKDNYNYTFFQMKILKYLFILTTSNQNTNIVYVHLQLTWPHLPSCHSTPNFPVQKACLFCRVLIFLDDIWRGMPTPFKIAACKLHHAYWIFKLHCILQIVEIWNFQQVKSDRQKDRWACWAAVTAVKYKKKC